jgi:zinc and cadmium transporter
LLLNFFTALTAFIGLAIAYFLLTHLESIAGILTPLAAGLFVYVAGSDLIPEMHKYPRLSQSLWQIFLFLCGIGVMVSLTLLE